MDTLTHANLCTVPANCGAGTEAKKEAGKEEGRFFATELPLAIGAGGTLYVADSRKIGAAESDGFNVRIQRFEPSGAYLGPQLLLPDTGTDDRAQALAVDSAGGIYVVTGSASAVHKYDAGGAPVTSWGEGGQVNAEGNGSWGITLDPAGNLFLSDFQSAPEILEYDPTGTKIKVFFPPGLSDRASGLAYYSGDLFAVDRHSVLRITLPDPGPLLVPGSLKASPVGNVKATLKVAFNPEGKAGTVRFEYITKADYEADGNSFGAGTLVTLESAPTAADFKSHTVEATNICPTGTPTAPSCLEPQTTYYFRAKAKNADGEVTGERAEFTTLPALQIPATWVADVGTDSARLSVEVNPLGLPTTGHFEYVEDATFQADLPNGFEDAKAIPGTIDFGSGEAPVIRASQAYPLQPGTTYHYRLVASDPYFPAVTSPEQTFATFAPPAIDAEQCAANAVFRTGPSAGLPDCRAYELVSPLDKANGDIITRLNVTGYPTNLNQSSAAGSGFTYSSYRAFSNPQSAPYTNQLLATRHERGEAGEGWRSESLAPPRGPQFSLQLENEFNAFSADLSNAWIRQEGEPTLDACAPAGFVDLYRRESASGAYTALSCAHPNAASSVYLPELQGFSSDSSHAVFRVDDALASSPPASAATVNTTGEIRPIYQVYESSGGGTLRLVSVLPNGEASAVDSSAGTAFGGQRIFNHNRFQSVDNAVSADGTRVWWSTGEGGGKIYLRTNADQAQSKVEGGQCTQAAKACTLAVSETVSSDPAVGKQPARFQTADPQGTKALFIVATGPLKDNLYEFDAQAEPPGSQLIAKKVLAESSILGASDDLSRVYYASEEASAGAQAEGAVKGEPNVYLYEEGTTRFVATLSTADLGNPYGKAFSNFPLQHTARVSPDGESLVFMSNSAALSKASAGYDNTDAASGEADAEVYLYGAGASGGAGKLRCVSCNPSGARPQGRELQGFDGDNNPGLNGWAAAAIPRPETQFYQPRYLSDDGSRVYFNGFDALVLADTNGKADAYQWEALGSGGCEAESPTYAPASEGCLSLLSSGQSPFDSEFLDAGSDGHDVFFTTAEGLLPEDYGLVDVYDARIDGGFPSPSGPTPSCEGEACQGPLGAPNDPTPASSAFEGAGNVVEKPARKKKSHKKKAHKKKAAKHKRANHKRRAGR